MRTKLNLDGSNRRVAERLAMSSLPPGMPPGIPMEWLDAGNWRLILDRRGFEVALLPVDWPLAQMLKLDPSWQVIKDDSHAILFRRLRLQSRSD